MSVAKSNGLIKILAVIVILAAILIVVKVFSSGQSVQNVSTQPTDVALDLTAEEQKRLGITAGDTPHDTLKTLTAEMRRVREENSRLVQINENLQKNVTNVEQQVNQAVENKVAQLTAQFEQKLNTFANQPVTQAVEYSGNSQATATTPATGFGTELPIGNGDLPANSQTTGIDEDGVRWVEPSDTRKTDEQGKPVDEGFSGKTKVGFPNPFKALDESPVGQAATQFHGKPNNRDENSITPYFTIPENATLMGSVAMTALLGRVPLNGAVSDPYPFKVLIGRENLIANGIELPDVEGAIVSGVVSGDWTLSCVRGKVESISFVFRDGRISNGKTKNTSASNSDSQNKGIGWLSDEAGVTCIAGERKTNAPEYLASQFLLSGAGAAAQSLASGQTTTVVDNGSVLGAVTGNQGKFILGQALGGGLKEVQEWFASRYGQMFDAIYVPPGKTVAVHITENLTIDYDKNARQVKYRQTTGYRQMD